MEDGPRVRLIFDLDISQHHSLRRSCGKFLTVFRLGFVMPLRIGDCFCGISRPTSLASEDYHENLSGNINILDLVNFTIL